MGLVIVVGIDFQQESLDALSIVLGIGNARVHPTHVVPFAGAGFASCTPTHVDARVVHSRLESLCARDRVLAQDIRPHVVLGDTADSLVEVAQEAAADLIVLGAGGRKQFGLLFRRSVTARVARTAPCSVVVPSEHPLGTAPRKRLRCVGFGALEGGGR